jgi:kynureninase
MTRDECLHADRTDPLAEHRQSFVLPEGVLYFDGNSLGALPRATAGAAAHVIEREWARSSFAPGTTRGG